MTLPRLPATALACTLILALIAGCSREPPPQAATDGAGSDNKAETFIGRQAAHAIEKAARKLESENIRLGDGFSIDLNGRRFGHAASTKTLPEAEITPDGDLLIDGDAIRISPEQRIQLLAYRGNMIDIARTGMAMGIRGADIAGKALTGLGEVIFGGEEGRNAYEQRIEAEAESIQQDAHRLCALLPDLYDSQQALATSLPAFAPYATMTLQDIEDCGKDASIGAPAQAPEDVPTGPATQL